MGRDRRSPPLSSIQRLGSPWADKSSCSSSSISSHSLSNMERVTLPVKRMLRKRFSKPLAFLLCLLGVLMYSFPDSRAGLSMGLLGKRMERHSLVLDDETGMAKDWKMGERRHPIEVLMEMGRKKWERMLRRQSKSLHQAVETYRHRYHRDPPRGFDVWYQWAVDNNVTFIDDYDQIYRDTHLFFGLAPDEMRRRREAIESEPTAFIMHLGPHTTPYADGGRPNFRADAMRNLLYAVAPLLPAETKFVVSTHDMGSTMMGDDQRQYLEGKIAAGEYADPTQEEFKWYEWNERYKKKGLPGMSSACPEGSPAWVETMERFERQGGPDPGPRPVFKARDKDHPMFIHDQRLSNDFCYNPDLLHFHGGLSYDVARGTKLRPMFHQSKIMLSPEIVLTPLDFYSNATHKGTQNQFLPWDEKDIDKLHWRGKMTGDFYSGRRDYNWRNSHRIRLHTMTHETEGQVGLYVKSRRTGEWEWQQWDKRVINSAYTDCGLTDQPFQCEKKDGTCDTLAEEIDFADRISPKEAARYKYVIDVDGNGWSSRFHRLMLSGSVVFKSTIYAEWFTDWLVPWYHYVPIQVSYAELYSTLAFFIGAPNAPSTGHDHLAKQIAQNGRSFAEYQWRWEDMQSYMFRLLLEYIRLEQDDREAWSYTG